MSPPVSINTTLSLLSAPSLESFYRDGYWQDHTIYSLVHGHALSSPDKTAIREMARQVSYRQLLDAADRLAAALEGAGVRPGQRVAVWLPSRIETAVAVLACSRQGYVCCPSLHRDHTVEETTDLLARMRASALIAEVGYGADGERADVFVRASTLDTLRLVIPLEAHPVDPEILPDLAPAQTGSARQDPNAVVYLAFTSGTTGEPKGVMHSDNTLLAPVRALAADWSLGGDMVVYSLSPLSHNLGFGAMVLALSGGGELVVHDLPRGASLFDRLVETGTTFLFGVPTHAIDLLAELTQRGVERVGRLRGFRVSGAAIPPRVAQELLDHGVIPQSGYGMTEAGSHHYTRPDDPAELIISSSGRPCAGYEARIFSRDGADVELAPGEVGQIGGRGASLMLGYFDDQTATEESFNASGWFMTGDLGWMDEAGNVRITGRKKDLIIRGGHNIFPAKIEALAMRHPGVEKAAAVPIPDDRLGERVCLVVTSRDGAKIDPTELLEHLDRDGLSKFDMPEHFLQVEELPLTASGKIFKRRLLEWVDEGRVTPSPVRFKVPAQGTEPDGRGQ